MKTRTRRVSCFCVLSACALAGLSATAIAQDVFVDLPSAPSGFRRDFGAFSDGSQLLLRGLEFGVTAGLTYDSNVNQGRSLSGSNGDESDTYATLGFNAAYRTQRSDFNIGVNYNGSYNEYFERSEYSGYNQGLGLVLTYAGAKLNASLSTSIDIDNGQNRQISAYSEQTSYTYQATANYRYSQKSSLAASLRQNFNEMETGGFNDTESLEANLSALYVATPLITVGPGISYSRDTGDQHPDRTAIGPTVTVQYKVSQKVSLNSMLGVDFNDYSRGDGDDTSFKGRLGVNYRANEIWGMNLSMYSGMQADPAVANSFNQITNVRLGYNRKVRRINFTAGLGYETNSYDNPINSSVGTDRNYWTFDTGVSTQIFRDTTRASLSFRYYDQEADQTARSYDGYSLSLSLSRQF